MVSLEIQQDRIVHRLGMSCDKKRGVEDDSTNFGLSHEKDGVVIY